MCVSTSAFPDVTRRMLTWPAKFGCRSFGCSMEEQAAVIVAVGRAAGPARRCSGRRRSAPSRSRWSVAARYRRRDPRGARPAGSRSRAAAAGAALCSTQILGVHGAELRVPVDQPQVASQRETAGGREQHGARRAAAAGTGCGFGVSIDLEEVGRRRASVHAGAVWSRRPRTCGRGQRR